MFINDTRTRVFSRIELMIVVSIYLLVSYLESYYFNEQYNYYFINCG